MFDDQTPQNDTKKQPKVEDMFEETDDASAEAPTNLPIAGGSVPGVRAAEAPSSKEDQSDTPDAPAPKQPAAPAPAQPKAPAVSAKPSQPAATTKQQDMPKKSSGLGKGLLIIVLALLIIGIAAWLTYALFFSQPVEDEEVLPEEDTSEVIDEEPEEEVPVEEEEPVDSDGDGLTDAQEAEAGTDPEVPDTDLDGLGDREEVEVYGTDPLEADTDGDSYLDGQEVEAGYNPNGDGKLFEIPQK